ncbi:MAG: glutamine--fructose-6-phosphate transaminase (isomerizing) [Actinobacteria bacterium]|uniref:Glutamine--fructose-6-phosphate aminotransferase [isomerizing] n=1 Tax=freshwater metagenome TaxID=449393 RepID=A0A6J7DU62_9ZZZZ|nr:glutamine--fructose-6-phosphate transaminase (isomerizing) [Actinomycetota bacterium]
MCGIIGYTGPRDPREILLAGLERLEYRGYDSAGIAVLQEGGADVVRAVGNLAALREAMGIAAGGSADASSGAVAVAELKQQTGIGHTRWATHGRVTEENAHPHSDNAGVAHVVVNGIIENFATLRRELEAKGSVFTSETDAEVVAHLVALHYQGDLVAAVREADTHLEGHYAFVAMADTEPGLLVGARRECPLVVGLGDGEAFIASAVPAFLDHTRSVLSVEDGEVVILRPEGVVIESLEGQPIQREAEEVDWDAQTAEKGGYETFMLKEIHEQAHALSETIADRTVRPNGVDLGDLGAIDDALLSRIGRIVVVACGTSYHAGLIGRYAIEAWARVPVEVELASEYRYRTPVVGPDDLVIGITQSGETRDTLAAMRCAQDAGATVLALTNIMGSQAEREADGVLFTRAGLEIGVAATKTFITQVAALGLLGLRLAELRGSLDEQRLTELVSEMKSLPRLVAETIEMSEGPAMEIGTRYSKAGFFLYIGRNAGLPIALEGALKLKEIAYVPTDAYAAGEMKHGPIALLDEDTPVVCVATDSPVLEKIVSNVMEVRARGAVVIGVETVGSSALDGIAEDRIQVPEADPILGALLAVIPLQLLAYSIARERGLNVDQPRNLAKTVTVE